MYEDYKKILDSLEKDSHLRRISLIEDKDEKYIYFNGKKLLNLSSNNYLNIADNRAITKEFLNEVQDEYCLGSASSRLLTGTLPVYDRLENFLAKLYEKDKALIFNSGYHANVGITSSICQKGDVIFSDKLNHASIIDGMRLSRGKFFRFPHNDMTALRNLLTRERAKFNNAFIICESIFSMDGDIEDLIEIIKLKEEFNCNLIVDEAHAFGIFGEKGLGICESLGITQKIDLIVGTFGKSVGSMGAFVVGSKTLIDFLINSARSFIFSTSLPPISVAFTHWIIKNKFPTTFKKRNRMIEIANGMNSQSHIIPIIIGSNKKTVDVCNILYENGYFTLPIRPPTVPAGTSRLRLSLTAYIEEQELDLLKEILNESALSK